VSILTRPKRVLRRAARTGREQLATARLCCERYALSVVGRRASREGGRILCYHSLGQPAWGVNDVSPERFRRHLALALDAGYRFVPASAIVRDGGQRNELAITFDDGLKSVATVAAPVLAELGLPWSLFVVSGWADRQGNRAWADEHMLSWAQIEKLMAAGAEIGSHSVTHPDFSTLDAGRVTDELGASRETIRERLGLLPDTFAVPFGQSKNWPAIAAKAAREAGYSTVYAQAEETRPDGTVPRTFVTRFDNDRVFKALLDGAFDRWEEWF
jgi:peptidoglycan/xylan/chitin deacetylase (PgdA/CDA1 family)